MKVAIFHYHLNRGGVAQVIANQLRALDAVSDVEPIEVFLFYGGRKADWPEGIAASLKRLRLNYVTLDQLDYTEACPQTPTGSGLAESILYRLAQCGLTTENCLLHFHNHNLGKNWALVEAIGIVQSNGYRMLLQIHDFAEDFRPDNYQILKRSATETSSNLLECLYPSATHVAFGVINRRDAACLEIQGIQPERINYLPNPVAAISGLSAINIARDKLLKFRQIDPQRPLLVYPVRGIRRKNIGEAILMTLLANGPIQVGLTLPPINPNELASYETWKLLSRELRLPVFFELGQIEKVSFPDILSAADQILTTSVAEGFGMAFLEGLAIGKPLIGRNIPGITTDFVTAGISFDNLYDQLRVPIETVFMGDYETALTTILSEFYEAYDLSFETSTVASAIAQVVEQGWIDFAKLPVRMQIDFVRTAFSDPETLNRFRGLNERISRQLASPTINEKSMEENRRRVADHFAFEPVGHRLLQVYQRLLKAPQDKLSPIQGPNQLIGCFLNPQSIFPSRFEKSVDREGVQAIPDWNSIILENTSPLTPISTGLAPKLRKIDGIRVVLFDVYGTLLISSSGDVGTDEKFSGAISDQETDRLDQMLAAIGLRSELVPTLLRQAIRDKHVSLRLLSVPYPEIDIVKIWMQLIDDAENVTGPGVQRIPASWQFSSTWIRELAIRYELGSNPVYPMPQMQSSLETIRNNGMKLGIISNAQFYTPLILQAFCQRDLGELGFDKRLVFFSCIFGRAKPDHFMYERAANELTGLGYLPGQVLYVGNDMIKDIVPANSVGFQTGLFAGDQRSLRLGGMSTESADLILTELSQIDECISNAT